MTLTVISPPGEAALSLAQAKAFLRVGHEGEDVLVADLVAAATARLEEVGGLALVTRTMRRSWLAWPSAMGRRGAVLRPGPAASLVAVRVVDAGGGETDVTDRFTLAEGRLCLRPGHWHPLIPSGGRAEVDFEAGFGAAEEVPADLVQALKLIVLDAYRRNDAAGLPQEARAILSARREVLL